MDSVISAQDFLKLMWTSIGLQWNEIKFDVIA